MSATERWTGQRFSWPDWFESDTVCLTEQQFDYLLDGFNMYAMRAHREQHFAHAI